ncbi:RNase adapter RapZ [Pseudaestuariivita atlantica]|uniref:GlmZ(SRNA)-inactivating NTPase n=1 Tax=Pseudaestuariivita atlantica TaxID=1317121 RepID=A0A0L1JN60_9RHOB|nr:RNase adapter RapZ [Pseudaestuariivita atlantica]KNG93191.1 glmZ(sRNA)-inactivating NTPase [Pseudaestuariivita atlantica]
MSSATDPAARLVLVTGPSGAGRSTAIAALEDLGYETIDNMPLTLVPRLLDAEGWAERPLALGLDARNRDFTPEAVMTLLGDLTARSGAAPELLYLDCRREVLLRRFSETRRRHPLAPQDAPELGIAREAELLAPVRPEASHAIDTSDLSPHDLRAEIARRFGLHGAQRLALSVMSFSYKQGLPRGADMVFDCRFLANPHWVPELRPLTGRDPKVAAHVAGDPRYAAFLEQVLGLLIFQLPACIEEGKTHFTVAFGCTGGRHRSVTLAETVTRGLAEAGWQVSVRHRELERQGIAPGGQGNTAAMDEAAQ